MPFLRPSSSQCFFSHCFEPRARKCRSLGRNLEGTAHHGPFQWMGGWDDGLLQYQRGVSVFLYYFSMDTCSGQVVVVFTRSATRIVVAHRDKGFSYGSVLEVVCFFQASSLVIDMLVRCRVLIHGSETCQPKNLYLLLSASLCFSSSIDSLSSNKTVDFFVGVDIVERRVIVQCFLAKEEGVVFLDLGVQGAWNGKRRHGDWVLAFLYAFRSKYVLLCGCQCVS